MKCKKAESIIEDLVLPTAINMTPRLKSSANHQKKILTYKDTILRIQDTSEDIKQQTVTRIKANDYYPTIIQIDLSTDVSNHAILILDS